mmetsp:Transcript_17634/g.28975  ORF Transcript_17634/g.28975 Transcript_17634/m.28975 type:complete len:98 (-) Transcript_17634:18-311(-)
MQSRFSNHARFILPIESLLPSSPSMQLLNLLYIHAHHHSSCIALVFSYALSASVPLASSLPDMPRLSSPICFVPPIAFSVFSVTIPGMRSAPPPPTT